MKSFKKNKMEVKKDIAQNKIKKKYESKKNI